MQLFQIETERLLLRSWHDRDWPEFFASTNTVEGMRWLGGVMDEERMAWQRARFESYARDFGHTFWPVERKADGALLGVCGLKRANQESGPQGDFEVGWRLRSDVWGQGYAKEAAAASLHHAFAKLRAPHVLALTVIGNTASWGLMKRLGMSPREELDFASSEFDAEIGTIIVYGITRAEWLAQQ
jgi:RimJ/RimL family protein N-acetyltransferase